MVWWCVWCPPPQGLEALAPPLKRREAAALLQAAPFLLEGGLLSQVRAHPRDGWGGGGSMAFIMQCCTWGSSTAVQQPQLAGWTVAVLGG